MSHISSNLPSNKDFLKQSKSNSLDKIRHMARKLNRAITNEIKSRKEFTPTESMRDMGGNTGSGRFSTANKNNC